jgi:hypothetical protein
MDPNVVLQRVMRLAQLDTSVFDEVRDDMNETIPAIVVAAVSALLAGLGAWLYWEIVGPEGIESAVVNSFLLGGILLLAMYGAAILIIYVVLAQAFRIQANLQSLIRTCGYASLPLALSIGMLVPAIYPLFAFLPLALLFLFMLHATVAATSAPTKEATIAVTAGFAVMVLVLGFIAQSSDLPDAPIGAGAFALLWNF